MIKIIKLEHMILNFSLTNISHCHGRSFSYGFSSHLERVRPWNPSKNTKVLDDFELEGVRAFWDASCYICLISYNSHAIDFSGGAITLDSSIPNGLLFVILYVLLRFWHLMEFCLYIQIIGVLPLNGKECYKVIWII